MLFTDGSGTPGTVREFYKLLLVANSFKSCMTITKVHF